MLAQEGLLEIAGKRGYRVVEFGAREIEDAVDLCGILEGTAARLVAETGPDSELLETLDICLAIGAQIVIALRMRQGARDDAIMREHARRTLINVELIGRVNNDTYL